MVIGLTAWLTTSPPVEVMLYCKVVLGVLAVTTTLLMLMLALEGPKEITGVPLPWKSTVGVILIGVPPPPGGAMAVVTTVSVPIPPGAPRYSVVPAGMAAGNPTVVIVVVPIAK